MPANWVKTFLHRFGTENAWLLSTNDALVARVIADHIFDGIRIDLVEAIETSEPELPGRASPDNIRRKLGR